MTNKELLDMFRSSSYLNFMKFLENEIEFVDEYPCAFCKDKPCGEDHCDRNKEYDNESND